MILVAPDSFKGTLTAAEVAAAIAAGLRRGGAEAEELPVADGGEGTAAALGGTPHPTEAHDPLGRLVTAEFRLLADGETAVVEAASASGLGRVEPGERDAWSASSRGTGELIAAALEAGAKRVIVAPGGSATSDGGQGALEALADAGVRPRSIEVVCDVRTPWERAAEVFGPQKGADPATVKRLRRRLDALAAAAPRDPRGVPMSGCGGGLSGGLWAHLGAKLLPGAAYMLDALRFDERMRGARFVVTGEGRLDAQTLAGKAVGEIATRCRQSGVACHAVVGSDRMEAFDARVLDLASIQEAGDRRRLAAAGEALAKL